MHAFCRSTTKDTLVLVARQLRNAMVSLRIFHLAPDDTELGVGGTAGEIFGRLALVNICDALSKIEVDILAIIKALDLHQCRVIVLVLQPPKKCFEVVTVKQAAGVLLALAVSTSHSRHNYLLFRDASYRHRRDSLRPRC